MRLHTVNGVYLLDMREWKSEYRNLQLQKEALECLFAEFFLPNQARLLQALQLAERAHVSQKRDDGDPYVIHPVRVARFLIEEMGERDADVVIAALLHDVVEDTDVTLDEIRQQFGQHVAMFVDSVTRPRASSETEEDKRVSKPLNYQKTLDTGSPETLRIKAADILDNMRSWEVFEDLVRSNSVRLKRWLDEARNYYFEIGKRAGHAVEQEMRRIAMILE